MPPIDLPAYGKGGGVKRNYQNDLQLRKSIVQLALSQSLFHPVVGLPVRGDDRMVPEIEQLKPLNALSTNWLESLQKLTDNTEPKFERSTIIVADEGGMGKTYSCSIALNWLLQKTKKSILIVCPPALMRNWFKQLKLFGHKVNWLKGRELAEGTIEPGFNLASTYSVGKYPLSQEISKQLDGKISCVLLDEAHRGMISGNELADALRTVCSVADKRILVTATPMRNGIGDLFNLVEVGVCNSDEQDAVKNLKEKFSKSKEFILNEWIPILNKIKINQANEDDIIKLQRNWKSIIPFSNDEETIIAEMMNLLPENYAHMSENGKIELAQDLHPLGRFLSVTLRDDLGSEKCESLYRTMRSRSKTYTHSEEYQTLVEEIIQETGKSARNILNECLANITHEYPAFNGYKPKSSIIKKCAELFESDERLTIIEEIIHSEIEQKTNTENKSRAVIIFCEHIATVKNIHSLLTDGIFANMNFDAHYFQNPEDNDEPLVQQNSDDIARELTKIGKKAIKRLQVLICGRSLAEGHNMNWATHIVHWHMPTKAAEELAQKNWRLDRRIGKEKTWATSQFNRTYQITYLINESKDSRNELNKIYSENRKFLNHRQHHEAPEDVHLVPLSDTWITRQWSDQAQGFFSAQSIVVEKLILFLEGKIPDYNGISASLSLQSLSSCIGMRCDDEIYVNGLEIGASQGYDVESYHVCIRMADYEERLQLAKFAPQTKEFNAISKWGMPGASGTVISLDSNGKLLTNLLKLLTEISDNEALFENQPYPFTFNGTGGQYVIHLGILSILNNDQNNLLRNYHQDNLPIGLLYRENDSDRFEFLRLKDLNDENHIQTFEQIMNSNKTKRVPLGVPRFTAVKLISDRQIPDYKSVLNPEVPILENGVNAYVDWLMAKQHFDNIDISNLNKNMLIPLSSHSDKTYRDNAATMYQLMQQYPSSDAKFQEKGWC